MRWVALLCVALVGCGDDHPANPDAPIDGPGEMTVTEMVGPGGGMVMLPGIELTIPPGALTSTEMISITMTGDPAPAGYTAQSAIYHLAPEGLVFTQPVSVTLALTSVASHTHVYWSKLSGAGFDDRGGTITGSSITASNTHFSDLFAGLLPVELVMTPSSVDFGTAGVGFSSTAATVTVENFGSQDTGNLAVTISGTNSTEFSITTSTCLTLGTDESCTTTIVCSPTSVGTKTATLTVGDGTDMISAPLTCAAITFSGLNVNPSLVSFGNVAVGTSSAPTSITIANAGNVPHGPISIASSGTDAADFQITQNACAGVTLQPAATCTFDVTFVPSAIGSRSAHASITGDMTLSVALSGTGIAPAQLTVTPPMKDFGHLGQSGATSAFTVRNVGEAMTGAIALTRTGDTEFSIVSDGCTATILTPNETCTFEVRFAPISVGVRAGNVVVMANPGASVSIPVVGSGLAPEGLLATPSGSTFGSHLVGATSASSQIILTNTSGTPTGLVSIALGGTNPGDFAIANDPCSGTMLAPAATCTLDVTFTPTTSGQRSAIVTASATPGGLATAGLGGTGLVSAQLSVTPGTKDFGVVGAGLVSDASVFTVRNTGNATSSPIAVSPPTSTAFSVESDDCTGNVLGANETCTFAARFAPTLSFMNYAADVVVTGGGSVTVSLFGQGVADEGLFPIVSPVEFGSHVIGWTSSSHQTGFSNEGLSVWGSLTISLTGPNASDFAISNDACNGATIALGAQCTLDVTFSPSAHGERLATVEVNATPGGSRIIVLHGTGVAPVLVAQPAVADIGNVALGGAGTFALQISNSGDAPSGTLATSLVGADSSQFSLGLDGCAGLVLAPSATCAIVVAFSPTTLGAKSVDLQVSGASGATLHIPTSGVSATPAKLQIAPQVADYGTVLVGVHSAPIAFTVTNIGGVTSGVVGGTFLAPDGSQFEIASTTCGVALAPGASCITNVRFAPTSAGAKTSTGRISATPGGIADAALSGTAVDNAQLEVSPTFADFGTVVVGAQSTPIVFTITNVGDVTSGVVQGTFLPPDNADFVIASSTCGVALAPDASCTTSVRFAPLSAGAKTSTGSIFASPGGTVGAALSGTAIGSAQLSMSPPFADFGNITVGQTSPAVTFTITNVGGTVSGTLMPAMTGANPGEFSVDIGQSSCLFATLAPSQECMVVIRFAPVSMGPKSASASLDASPGGNVTAPLSGAGI